MPDQEWARLADCMEKGHSFAVAKGQTTEEAKRQLADSFLADADAYRDFYRTNPDHKSAAEARQFEAIALIKAWQVGDEATNERRVRLVTEFRGDATIPAARRSEVAAFAENVAVEKRSTLSRIAKLAAYEEVARKLMVEFPDLPDAYEALIQIAKDGTEEQASVAAADIIQMAKAPTWVKQEARWILIRQQLVGESIIERTRLIFAANSPFSATNRPLAIYMWASGHPPSVGRAKDLLAQLPRNFGAVGICLDQRNLEPARNMALQESLPGEQVYDWLGRRGELAQELGAVEPGLIYLVDAEGIVRSVSAHRDLPKALAAIGTK